MKKIIIICFSIFLLLFAIFSYTFVDPNLFYIKPLYTGVFSNFREITAYIYLLFIFLFFIFYGFFIFLAKVKKITIHQIKLVLIVAIILLGVSYPAMLSFDIFNYIATSKVVFLYNENPYIVMPIDIQNEPMLTFMHAPNKVSLYGPLWILLTGLPYLLSFGNFLLMVILMKVMLIGFYAGLVYLLWKLSHSIFTVVFFALNPLVIIDTLGAGHNDVAMMFFAIGAFYFIQRKQVPISILLFIASILIKYATIFLIPVYIYVLWQTVQNKKIVWDSIWKWGALSMGIIFLLSPLREEFYSWYFIWPLTFIALLAKYNFIFYIAYGLSLGLLLRAFPFIYTGSYFGITPLIKKIVTITPVVLAGIMYVIKKPK